MSTRTAPAAATLSVSVAILAVAAGGVDADSYREDFGNVGGWSFGAPDERIETSGGHPGAYLHAPVVDTFAPQPRTTSAASPFTGNFRRRHVAGIGVDIQVFDVDFSAEDRPLSLILTNTRGTPDPADDCSVYLIGSKLIPVPGQGWRSFSFPVPSDSVTLPAGWGVLEESCRSLDPDKLWTAIIKDVDEVRFFFGDPLLFYIFQQWDVGLDGAFVTRAP
jgi:hypothetical protein